MRQCRAPPEVQIVSGPRPPYLSAIRAARIPGTSRRDESSPGRDGAPILDVLPVARMTGEQHLVQPLERRVIAKDGFGRLGVNPSQDPTVLGCPEASSEDVVEGVQVPCHLWWQSSVENSRVKPSKSEKFAPSVVRTGRSSLFVATIEV
jgi:hypothetical protein